MDRYLTLREVCAWLRISPQTARRLSKRGALPALNLTPRSRRTEYRFSAAALRRLVASHG